MKLSPFNQAESRALTALAVFGLLVPNGVFLYFSATDWELLVQAMTNPVSAVFIGEAFLLMFLFAWLLARSGARRPSATGFVVLSLVGGMAFSIPYTLRKLMDPDQQSDIDPAGNKPRT
jgi:hypothetical protein